MLVVNPAVILKGSTGSSASEAIRPADAVDRAVNALTADAVGVGVLDYVRAKNAASATASFTTRAGNTCTPGSGGAFVDEDADFNGSKVFDLTGMSAVGFPTDAVCTDSFTVVLPIRVDTQRATTLLFSTAGSQFAIYLNNLGKVVMDEKYGSGESPFVFTNIAAPINTTRLMWFSHDAATKTSRYGIGNAVDESHVHTIGHVSTLASYARFLSFYQSLSSSTLIGQAEGWLLTDHAYAAAATAEDNAIAAVLTAWRGVLGL